MGYLFINFFFVKKNLLRKKDAAVEHILRIKSENKCLVKTINSSKKKLNSKISWQK